MTPPAQQPTAIEALADASRRMDASDVVEKNIYHLLGRVEGKVDGQSAALAKAEERQTAAMAEIKEEVRGVRQNVHNLRDSVNRFATLPDDVKEIRTTVDGVVSRVGALEAAAEKRRNIFHGMRQPWIWMLLGLTVLTTLAGLITGFFTAYDQVSDHMGGADNVPVQRPQR